MNDLDNIRPMALPMDDWDDEPEYEFESDDEAEAWASYKYDRYDEGDEYERYAQAWEDEDRAQRQADREVDDILAAITAGPTYTFLPDPDPDTFYQDMARQNDAAWWSQALIGGANMKHRAWERMVNPIPVLPCYWCRSLGIIQDSDIHTNRDMAMHHDYLQDIYAVGAK